MFIGHFAFGFGLKRAAPEINLGWLIASVVFLDLIWPIFLLAGVERVEIEPGNTAFTPFNFVHYPYSHSLAMAVVWSVVFAGFYYLISRYKAGAVAVGSGVLSHWLLDAIVHRPDLPLYPGGSEMIGLGLWNSVSATIIVESVMFIIGVGIYLRMTQAKDRIGSFGMWAYLVTLILIYVGNIVGPPPSSVTQVATVTLFVWIFVLWPGWADRHRSPKAG